MSEINNESLNCLNNIKNFNKTKQSCVKSDWIKIGI